MLHTASFFIYLSWPVTPLVAWALVDMKNPLGAYSSTQQLAMPLYLWDITIKASSFTLFVLGQTLGVKWQKSMLCRTISYLNQVQ
jgi:hypothetical protein